VSNKNRAVPLVHNRSIIIMTMDNATACMMPAPTLVD
jgi:hypothetical protein